VATREQGFSLIEVLVALAILSIGLIAASRGAFQATTDQGFLRDRTFARWVAHNQLAALRLSPQPISAGAVVRERVVQGGVAFDVATTVTATPSPLFSRVQVDVRRASDSAGDGPQQAPALASAVGFAAARARP